MSVELVMWGMHLLRLKSVNAVGVGQEPGGVHVLAQGRDGMPFACTRGAEWGEGVLCMCMCLRKQEGDGGGRAGMCLHKRGGSGMVCMLYKLHVQYYLLTADCKLQTILCTVLSVCVCSRRMSFMRCNR
jgi:hypothetical protein